MNKERAAEVVRLVDEIAQAQAAIRLNLFCDSVDKAIHNSEILAKAKLELTELLTDADTSDRV